MATPASPVASTPAKPAAAPPAPTDSAAAPKPWTVELKKLVLEQYAIKILDYVPADPVTLTVAPIGLTVGNFSTAKNNKAAVTLKLGLNKTGTIAANGTFSLDPLSATVKLDAQGLDLVPLQPYVAEKVNLVVTSGAASAQGTVSLSTPKPNEPVLGYTGDIALAKFAVIDKTNSEDLIRFSHFAVNGIRLATSPFALDIKAVTLADLAAHLTMNADKTLNVGRLMVTPPPG
ncbi:MAG: DUF748 domain-containing protein, partial [Nitrospira sp.]